MTETTVTETAPEAPATGLPVVFNPRALAAVQYISAEELSIFEQAIEHAICQASEDPITRYVYAKAFFERTGTNIVKRLQPAALKACVEEGFHPQSYELASLSVKTDKEMPIDFSFDKELVEYGATKADLLAKLDLVGNQIKARETYLVAKHTDAAGNCSLARLKPKTPDEVEKLKKPTLTVKFW